MGFKVANVGLGFSFLAKERGFCVQSRRCILSVAETSACGLWSEFFGFKVLCSGFWV